MYDDIPSENKYIFTELYFSCDFKGNDESRVLSQMPRGIQPKKSKPYHKRLRGSVNFFKRMTKATKAPWCECKDKDNIPNSGNYWLTHILVASHSKGSGESTLSRPRTRFSHGGREWVSSIGRTCSLETSNKTSSTTLENKLPPRETNSECKAMSYKPVKNVANKEPKKG